MERSPSNSPNAPPPRLVATKHDAKGSSTGGRVYEVCTACHKEFVIDPMLKAGGRPIGMPLPDWPADQGQAKQLKLRTRLRPTA